MRVEVLGDGSPALAVVAAVHGDEPCGVRAVERLLAADPAVERPVKLVVANEAALARGERFVDEDLNRAFPADPDADTHEAQLAGELGRELQGCRTLALHSTQSHDEPFAVVDDVTDPAARALCSRLPVTAVVETGGFVEGRLFTAADLVEVECGRQGTDAAADNAERLVRAFLAATGALDGGRDGEEVPAFRLTRRVPKRPADEYEVFVENFRRVPAGESFAAVDGAPVLAEEAFYPVLMSPYGYDSVFGYAAEKVGAV